MNTDPDSSLEQIEDGMTVLPNWWLIREEPGPSLAGYTAAKLASKQFKAGRQRAMLRHKAEKILEKLEKDASQADITATGTLFEQNDEIPAPLLGPNPLDSQIDGIVAAYKPLVEQIMYWENLKSALFLTFAIPMAYWAGRLGFSIATMLFILFFVSAAFKRNQLKLKKKIHHDTRVVLGMKKVPP